MFRSIRPLGRIASMRATLEDQPYHRMTIIVSLSSVGLRAVASLACPTIQLETRKETSQAASLYPCVIVYEDHSKQMFGGICRHLILYSILFIIILQRKSSSQLREPRDGRLGSLTLSALVFTTPARDKTRTKNHASHRDQKTNGAPRLAQASLYHPESQLSLPPSPSLSIAIIENRSTLRHGTKTHIHTHQ